MNLNVARRTEPSLRSMPPSGRRCAANVVLGGWLFDEIDGRITTCELTLLTSDHLRRAKQSWVPEFCRRRFNGVIDEDAILWNRGFVIDDSSRGDTRLRGFAIDAENEVQGVVILDESLRANPFESGSECIYVRYLATAPWNRPLRRQLGRFRRVGRLLTARAVLESIARGGGGRIGLHAFRDAGTFYERLGFLSRGFDPNCRGMIFFDLPCSEVEELLSALCN